MSNKLSLKNELEKIKPKFIQLTDEQTFNKEVSFALQHISKNSQLKKATLESNLQAVMNVAQIGLSLNPTLKQAYLVPRTANKNGQWVVETHLEPSYQGLCKLVTDTGSAKSISAHLVYDGDIFEPSLGTDVQIKHIPKFESKDLKFAYMVAILSDDSKMVEIMTKNDLYEIRERSESYKAYKSGRLKSCVWISDEGEMCRKTVLRRGIKYLPKTDLWDKLGEAVSLDEYDYKASISQINTIESLLRTSCIDHDERQSIENEFDTMTQSRALELISYLNENQLDPINAGANYSQTDISLKVKKES